MRGRTTARELFRGTTGRGRYAAIGIALIALKYGLDRALASLFDRTWTYTDYWSPSSYAVDSLPTGERVFFLALASLAVPFAIVGLSLTVRRLRHAGLPLGLVVLFFVPVVNLVFFATLCLLPPSGCRAPAPADAQRRGAQCSLLPSSKVGSAFAGVVLTALLGGALMAFATEGLELYGWACSSGCRSASGSCRRSSTAMPSRVRSSAAWWSASWLRGSRASAS